MEAIKLTVKQIILQFKTLLKSPVQVLLILLIPFLITTTLPIFFFGLKDAYGIDATLSVAIVSFALYSYFVGEYRKSTLYKNLQSTKSNKWIFNLSSFITILLMGYFTYFFHWVLMSIYANLNVLQYSTGVVPTQYNLVIRMAGIPFVWTYYWVSMIVLICYSISFGLYRIIDNSKTYYIFIITIVLLDVIFGATFNNYFSSIYENGSYQTDFLVFNWSTKSLFPPSMFVPSLFHPLYAPSQMLCLSGAKTIYKADGVTQYYDVLKTFKWQTGADYEFIGLANQAWRWNILYFIPFMQCIAWMAFGIVVSRIKRK